MKTKQMTVVFSHSTMPNSTSKLHQQFKVIKGQDQTDFLPGSLVDGSELERLCRNGAWKVVILPPKEGGAP